MPTVLLIRHGQASFGAADYDVLSAIGKRQAEILAAALARRGIEPSRVISGSMRRQIDTAAALAGPAPEVDPRWDEYDSADVLTHHSDSSLRLDGPGAQSGEPLTSKGFQAILEPALETVAPGAVVLAEPVQLKGLEFSHLYLLGLRRGALANDGHADRWIPDELLDGDFPPSGPELLSTHAARLAHTAMTRAMDSLVLSWPAGDGEIAHASAIYEAARRSTTWR